MLAKGGSPEHDDGEHSGAVGGKRDEIIILLERDLETAIRPELAAVHGATRGEGVRTRHSRNGTFDRVG